MQIQTKKLEEEVHSVRESVIAEYTKKMDEMANILHEKESAYKIVQQEFNTIKDFRVR